MFKTGSPATDDWVSETMLYCTFTTSLVICRFFLFAVAVLHLKFMFIRYENSARPNLVLLNIISPLSQHALIEI